MSTRQISLPHLAAWPLLPAATYRPLAWVTVLLLAGASGWLASPRLALFIAVGLGAFLAGLLFLLRPGWGLLAILPLTFFGRLQIDTSTLVPANLTVLAIPALVGVWLVRKTLLKEAGRTGKPGIPVQVQAPAFLFFLACSLSLLAGNLPWLPLTAGRASLPAQLGAMALLVLPVVLLLLSGAVISTERLLSALTWTFLSLGSLFFLFVLIPPLQPLAFRVFARGAAGSMFYTWYAVLAFSQLAFNRRLPRAAQLACILMVAAVFYQGWRSASWLSGWLPGLIGVLVASWLRSPRWGAGATAITVLVGLLLAPSTLPELRAAQTYSQASRLEAWRIILGYVRASPLFGLGPANYYFYVRQAPIFGYYVPFVSHNNYIDVLAQTGAAGLAALLWLLAALGRLAWGLRCLPDAGLPAYANSALAGLVATAAAGLMGDWFMPFVYNLSLDGLRAAMLPWLFLGGLLALPRLASHKTGR